MSRWWVAAAVVGCSSPEPDDLMLTGLYADELGGEIAVGVEAYEPQFPLWTDGAEKQRWIQLTGVIDTSDPDAWIYPEGTRVWKEFAVDGMRVETRMLHKVNGRWTRTTYLWNEAQSEATRITRREPDALATDHDVPSRGDCLDCHGTVEDTLLGFSAVQLSHDGPGLTLTSLAAGGLLSDPVALMEVPGDEVGRAALGYLHGNCGMCHHPQRRGFVPDLVMWLSPSDLGTVEQTATFRTAVGREQERGDVGGAMFRIDPGNAENSVIVQRMAARDDDQMPPLGTEVVDDGGLDVVSAWISGL